MTGHERPDEGPESRQAAPGSAAEPDPQRLLHALQLDQIELELQNEELRRVQEALEVSRSLYVRLYDRSPVAYCTLDGEGVIQQANFAAATLLGVAREDLPGQPFGRFIPAAGQDRFHLHFRQLVVGAAGQSCELRMQKKDGAPFWANLCAVAERDVEGQRCVQLAFSDISASKRAEEALREQKDFFHQIAEHLSDFIAVLDLQGRRLYNSPSYQQFFGASHTLADTDSFADIHPDDRERVKQMFRETVRSGQGHQISYRFVRPDGSIRDMASQGDVIRDRDGRIVRVLVVSRDITEHKRLEERVHRMAFHDALTGLPNRRLLGDRLNQAITASARSASHGALLFLDLDNFKPLNDAHGHDVGDLLLIEAAGRLTRCVREMDTVARFGGDEFVVMLSQLDEDPAASRYFARAVAEKLRLALAQPYLLPLGPGGAPERVVEHRCTVSIGLSLFGGKDASPGSILKRADMAMYRAKEAGGNRVRFATAEGEAF